MVTSLHGCSGDLRERKGNRAFTLIELAVIMVCVALLACLLIPAVFRALEKRNRACCNCNLKQIGLAYREWEGDYSDKYPMSVSTNKGGTMEWGAGSNMFRHYQVMSNELNNTVILVCPVDNRREAPDFTNMDNRNVSYFVGLDTDETFPAMPLSGDRNLLTNGAVATGLAVIQTNDTVGFSKTMHYLSGNVGLADGSVQQMSSAGLQVLFQQSGTNLNRLAIP